MIRIPIVQVRERLRDFAFGCDPELAVLDVDLTRYVVLVLEHWLTTNFDSDELEGVDNDHFVTEDPALADWLTRADSEARDSIEISHPPAALVTISEMLQDWDGVLATYLDSEKRCDVLHDPIENSLRTEHALRVYGFLVRDVFGWDDSAR